MLSKRSIDSLKRLLNEMKKHHTIDLSDFSIPHLMILMEDFMEEHRVKSIEEVISKINLSGYWYEKLFLHLQINDTELFRDPSFWKYLRTSIMPLYKRTIKVWFPDLASGEELYSFAILCKELNIYDRVSIDAFSMCKAKLEAVQNGYINSKQNLHNLENYKRYNGYGHAADHFIVNANKTHLRNELLSNVNFQFLDFTKYREEHQYDLVFFRNKMLYFNTTWQNKVLDRIYFALKPNGFMVIGVNEDLANSSFKFKFDSHNLAERIYKKK